MKSTATQRALCKAILRDIEYNMDPPSFWQTVKQKLRAAWGCVKKGMLALRRALQRDVQVESYTQIKKRYLAYLQGLDDETLEELQMKLQFESRCTKFYVNPRKAEIQAFKLDCLNEVLKLRETLGPSVALEATPIELDVSQTPEAPVALVVDIDTSRI